MAVLSDQGQTFTLPFSDYPRYRQELKRIALDHPGSGFVYKLCSVRDGRRVPVPRLAGHDADGILYIGQTTKLLDRLALLYRSFKSKYPEGKRWQHGADELYWQCQAAREQYPRTSLWVEITPCTDSKQREHDEVARYGEVFGEVPPFNGAIIKPKL